MCYMLYALTERMRRTLTTTKHTNNMMDWTKSPRYPPNSFQRSAADGFLYKENGILWGTARAAQL